MTVNETRKVKQMAYDKSRENEDKFYFEVGIYKSSTVKLTYEAYPNRECKVYSDYNKAIQYIESK